MIVATYTASTYRADDVVKRHVRKSFNPGKYRWCEVNAKNRDVRQGYCDSADLPPAVRDICDERGTGPWYACEWPL